MLAGPAFSSNSNESRKLLNVTNQPTMSVLTSPFHGPPCAQRTQFGPGHWGVQRVWSASIEKSRRIAAAETPTVSETGSAQGAD